MSVEIVPGETSIQTYMPETAVEQTAQKLAELILKNEGARQVYDDFMWDYVGHPDPWYRTTGAKHIDERMQVVYSGYGEQGSLVHVRAVPGELRSSDRYFVAQGDLVSGTLHEPHLVLARAVGGIVPQDVLLYLHNQKARSNWPPGYYPGNFKHARDQLRLQLHLQDSDPRPHELNFPQGQGRHEMLRPIEQLCQAVQHLDAHAKVQQEVGRHGLVLVDAVLTAPEVG